MSGRLLNVGRVWTYRGVFTGLASSSVVAKCMESRRISLIQIEGLVESEILLCAMQLQDCRVQLDKTYREVVNSRAPVTPPQAELSYTAHVVETPQQLTDRRVPASRGSVTPTHPSLPRAL